MYHFKCIHPPGSATAFTAVMGGQASHEFGFECIFIPVLANAFMMLALAFMINLPFSWRRYPAALSRPVETNAVVKPKLGDNGATAFSPSRHDLLAAMRSLDSFVDISEDDLVHLAKKIAQNTRKDSVVR